MKDRSQLAETQAAAAVKFNSAHNGVEVHFPEKPDADTLAILKGAGFRWSRYNKCWYKKLGSYSWATAHRAAGIEQIPPMPSNIQPIEDRAAEMDRSYLQAQEDAFIDEQARACGAMV